MSRIPDHFIQSLLTRADITEVVGQFVTLKKTGANLLGLCPFHQEKSPSFTVNQAKQFYHCFGCGVSGSPIGFVMAYQNISFIEAVKQLAAQYGMLVPEERFETPEERIQAQQKPSLLDLLARANDFYRAQLKAAPIAIDYLKARGVSGEIAAKFGLGYSPKQFNQLQTLFGLDANKDLVTAGLLIEKENGEAYDRFRGRLMFPIRNVRGQVLGFGARVLDDSLPKYLNSPETPLFEKGHELYGLFEARQAIRELGLVLVVEGYMDVVALAQFGFGAAVATLGTACTATHIQKLLRHSDRVIFSFDGDAAGRKAGLRALHESLAWVTEKKTIQFLFLPPEHDPDSFIRTQGAPAFTEMVDQAIPLSEFFIQALSQNRSLQSVEGRAAIQSEGREWLSQVSARDYRQQLAQLLAHTLNINITDILPSDSQMQTLAKKTIERKTGMPPQRTASAIARPFASRSTQNSIEKQIIVMLLAQPRFYDLLTPDIEARCSERLASEIGAGDLFARLCASCREHPELNHRVLCEMLSQQDPRFDPLIKLANDLPFESEQELFNAFSAAINKSQLDAITHEISILSRKKNLSTEERNTFLFLSAKEKTLRARYSHSSKLELPKN